MVTVQQFRSLAVIAAITSQFAYSITVFLQPPNSWMLFHLSLIFLSYLADIYALMTLLISNLSGKHVKKTPTKNLQLDQYLTSVIKRFAHTYYICI